MTLGLYYQYVDRARHVLMGGQVALALVLLVSSGLMVRSFQKLRAIDPGFDPASALTFRVGLPARGAGNFRRSVATTLPLRRGRVGIGATSAFHRR